VEAHQVDSKLKLPPIEDVKWYELPEPAADIQEPTVVNDQTSALMAMRAALAETTAGRGWVFVERFAETVVRDLEAKALEEEDDTKANGLRRDARGARKSKDDLFKRIQIACNFDTKDGFVEVVTD
jgi:hypothetical protein